MKWYTFGGDNNSETVNLLLDHNTTAKIPWNKNNDNTDSSQIDAKVASDTEGWVGSPRLITADEIAKITKHPTFNSATSTSDNYFYFDTNTTSSDPNSGPGTSKYAWLFDRTNSCTSYGCDVVDNSTSGYWTSTTVLGSSSGVWRVIRYGLLGYGASDDGYSTSGAGTLGVRPVITISKSLLK